MPRVRIPLNNFSFGEVNPSLSSRTDNAIYSQSAEVVENFYVRPEGGLKKRAGTWVHDGISNEGTSASTSNMDVRLEPFIFSDDEKYIIAFDNGGFTPYKVEPNTTNALNSSFGSSLGISQLERIKANQQFRNQLIGYGPSSFNTTSRVRFKITLDPDHNYPTTFNSNSTMPIRRGTTVLRIDEDATKLFTPANNVFLYDETYTGTSTTTDVGGTKLNITVSTIKSGVNGASTKYNIRYTNDGDITLKFEIDNEEIILNPDQFHEEFAQSSTSWSVTFKEDEVKEIWTAGYGDGSTGNLAAFNDPDVLQDNVLTNIGPVTGITAYSDSTTDYVPCPWTSATLNQFTYTQRGDFMFICHDTWQPVMIVRTALNRFELRQFSFDTSSDGNRIFQPYYNFQSAGATLTPSGTTGSITLTSSEDYFNSAHVGTTLKIGETEATITAFTSTKVVTATILGTLQFQLDQNPLAIAKNSDKLTITHALHGLSAGATITLSECSNSNTSSSGVSTSNLNRSHVVHKVIDENTYQVTLPVTAGNTDEAFGGFPFLSSTAATTEWFEQSYSAYRGYPQAITFHEDRLWFAGTPSQPLGIWASRTGQYFNFNIGSEDDDALDIEANIGVQAQIRHLVSNRDLQVFSSEFEFFIPAFTDQAVTASNAKISSQTPFGSGYVKPQPFDGVTIYSQADGNTVRDFIYSDAEGAYVSNPISLLSSHMTKNTYQSAVLKGGLDQSGSYLFLMRSKSDEVDYTNTELLVYYQIRGDRKAGWMRWTTDFGYMQSICVIGNRLFVATNRKAQNTTNAKLFQIEEFTNAVSAEACSPVHIPNTTESGVYVQSKAEGAYFAYGNKAVMFSSSNIYLGEFTLGSFVGGYLGIDIGTWSTDHSGGYIGIPFTAKATTLALDALVEGGPLTGRPRRITKVVADLQDTKSVVINGTPMIPSYVGGNINNGIQAVSERKEFFVRGITKDPKVVITQDKSLPCQIDGIVVEVAF